MTEPIESVPGNANALIEAFGGIRPMAHKLDVPVSTVQGWKQRNAIPDNRMDDIHAAAAAHNVDLSGIETSTASPAGAGPEPSAPPEPERAPPSAFSPPQAPPRAQRGGVALAVAILALVVAVGGAAWPFLNPADTRTDTADAVAALSARVVTLEGAQPVGDARRAALGAEVAGLRAEFDRLAAAQPGEAQAARIAALGERIDAISSDLDRLQTQSSAAADLAGALAAQKNDLAQLSKRLDDLGALSANSARGVANAVALALAVGRLQRTLDSGAPYVEVLATLRSIAGGDADIAAALDQLAPQAASGVATRVRLAREFPAVARVTVAAAESEAATDWTERALQRVESVVSIRRIGLDVAGDAPQARIARAEAKLSDGDLSGAVDELAGLQGAAATAAAPWRERAAARLAGEAAAARLETLAIARLQSGGQ